MSMIVPAEKRFRALGAVFAALLLVACESAEQRAIDSYERGLALLAEDEPDRAVLEFRNALQLDSGNNAARLELAKIFEANGNLRGAVGNYSAVAETDQTNVESRVRLGRIFLAGGDLESAARYLDEALALEPQDAPALAAKAALRLRQGDSGAARDLAGSAIAVAPDLPEAHVTLATERLASGDVDGALAILDRRIAAQPGEAIYGVAKLQILGQQGRTEAIGPHLRYMADAFPDQRQFREALATWLASRGALDEAETEFRALADTVDGVTRLIAFLRQARGEEAALEELNARIAAAEGETRAGLQLTLAELQLATGASDASAATLETIIAENATTETVNRARLQLATFALRRDDPEEALRLAQVVLDEDAENGEALALRAAVAINDLRPDDAIADMRAALGDDPENIRYMLLLATAHERNGEMTAAGERLAAAMRTSDFEPRVAQRYALFLRSRGDLRGAEAALSESARRHRGSRSALAALAQARLELEDWIGAEEVARQLRELADDAEAANQVAAAVLRGQGRESEGLELLASTVEQNPQGAALANLVSGLVTAGDTARAIEVVEAALERDPENLRALLLRAELHLLSDEIAEVEARLDDVIAAAPNSQLGYLALSRYHANNGDLAAAEAAAQRGIAAVEDDAQLRFLLAQFLEQRGDFSGAIALYGGLYDENPDSVIFANNFASLVAEHREEDEALVARAARIAQRLRGYDVPQFQDTYGWLLFLQGEYPLALTILSDAARALPNNPLVRYHAGRAYAALDQTEAAQRNLEAALAIDPDFPKAPSARAALEALAAPPPQPE